MVFIIYGGLPWNKRKSDMGLGIPNLHISKIALMAKNIILLLKDKKLHADRVKIKYGSFYPSCLVMLKNILGLIILSFLLRPNH